MLTSRRVSSSITSSRLAALATAAALVALMMGPAPADAATATQPLTINATVAARATLTLGSAAINFPDSDPATVPSIAATENPVSVAARVRTGSASTPTLTVLAGGDLTSGLDTIAISNVTWTAAAAPFTGGTMNSVTGQPAATFGAGSGAFNSTFSYFLANSWAYNVGAYTATVTYTLTAP